MFYRIEFSLALIFEIQAICISLIIFIYFAQKPATRLKQQHHSWLVLLILNFVQLIFDLPVALSFYYRGRLWPESDAFCAWWVWLSFSCDTTALFLMAWISIERNILVFHSQNMTQVGWKKWILHVLPLIICLIWAPIVYLILIVSNSQCTNAWNYETLLCGPPCYTYTGFLGIYDFVFNVCVSLGINILVNALLIIRVVREKMSHQPAINWRRHRKMILQFWAISTLHIALWSPLVIVSLIQMTAMPSFMADQYTTLEYILYYMPLLLPATCLSAIPDLVNKIMNFGWKRRRNVAPMDDIHETRRRTAVVSVRQTL
ncbi:unnamed protein product [Adineta ricciae]|uniref:G-protein coupled receptors family 1 profile domain-containing protein n=1 Tax=Adineta ricciae TaxID=249248 RepID=A0A815KC12_ADIRI|nr:unnamed protein product [Adineta ricciae]CAF1391198.1 unnamed protein product [Adineta ricciae]